MWLRVDLNYYFPIVIFSVEGQKKRKMYKHKNTTLRFPLFFIR